MDPDKIIATIVVNETNIPATLIAVENQDFKAPKDKVPYATVAYKSDTGIGSGSKFDPNNNEENIHFARSAQILLEIKGFTRDVITEKNNFLLGLRSQATSQLQETENVRVFPNPEVVNLSAVEGSSSLHRWQITVTIAYIVRKTKSVEYYDKTREVEELTT